MAVAQPCATRMAADAAQPAAGPAIGMTLEAAESLVGNPAPEAAWCRRWPARHQRIGGLVELLDCLFEQPPQLHHVLHQLVRKTLGFDAKSGGGFDQLGDLRKRVGAELARLALKSVRGNHE